MCRGRACRRDARLPGRDNPGARPVEGFDSASRHTGDHCRHGTRRSIYMVPLDPALQTRQGCRGCRGDNDYPRMGSRSKAVYHLSRCNGSRRCGQPRDAEVHVVQRSLRVRDPATVALVLILRVQREESRSEGTATCPLHGSRNRSERLRRRAAKRSGPPVVTGSTTRTPCLRLEKCARSQRVVL